MTTTYELTLGGKTKRSTLGTHTVQVDWDALPEPSKDFAIRYGLRQYLADAMAGAEDEADAKAKVDARLAKLVSGDLTRTQGSGGLNKPDTVDTRAAKLARAVIMSALKDANQKAEKDVITAAVKAMVEGDPQYKEMAAQQIKAETGMKTAKTLDLASLGIVLPTAPTE